MIEYAKSYKSGDQLFTTLVAAQTHELATLLAAPINEAYVW